MMKTALLSFLVFATLALAEPAELPLPKCSIPLSELATTSKGALVATLISVGPAGIGPPGASNFDSRWKLVRTLRGNYPNEIELSFRTQTIPEQHRERKPTVGQTYILITYAINPNQVAYMFERTDAKEREIQQLLSGKSK